MGIVDCQWFIDKYSHLDVLENLVLLHLCFNLHVAKVFLEQNISYLSSTQHESTTFEAYMSIKCPSSLQLFVSSNYGSMIHKDVDFNLFTLA